MLDVLWLVPAMPFAGYLILGLAGRRIGRTAAAWIGVGSVGVSACLALLIGFSFLSAPPTDHRFIQTLWIWMNTEGFTPAIAFQLDELSLLMMLVVTFVGFLIHLYSVEFMADDEAFSRFFAYMNLFVGSMLVLVLADNLLLLYLGWEGVGLCSYLLIGFWYKDPDNGRAARKAFIVTRIGDTAFGIGLFLLFTQLGTLTIRDLLVLAPTHWSRGSGMAVAAAALLLGGALGKSGQLPLQVWLPDAMAGPTPVSALIHAATMVTAGVYLIARMHVLFTLAPSVQAAVAIIGAVTLLLAGMSALTQRNIKRVLAYSTISQIGYMFLALGVGAFSAAMFHFFTHAFFKALLFLGAGVVINALHHEHDMFKMGGMKRKLPLVYWTFLIGSASLAAVPLVTAGFYSKDLIIWEAWSGPMGGPWLWAAGLFGAFVTSIYTFRMVFVTFFGEPKGHTGHKPGAIILIPLVVLAFFSVVGGFLELPHTMGQVTLFSDFMRPVLPAAETHGEQGNELLFQIVAAVVSLSGILIAYLLYYRRSDVPERLAQAPVTGAIGRLWAMGWGFDWVYDRLIVRPYEWLARINKRDIVDALYNAIAYIIQGFFLIFSRTQTGLVRQYAAGIALGAIITIVVVMFL
jgi:NADH-quinone oxidoreductase subunit L